MGVKRGHWMLKHWKLKWRKYKRFRDELHAQTTPGPLHFSPFQQADKGTDFKIPKVEYDHLLTIVINK